MMHNTIKSLFSLIIISSILLGCGSGDDAFTDSGTTGTGTGTGGTGTTTPTSTVTNDIPSEKGLYMTYSNEIFAIIDTNGNFTQTTGTITVHLADRFNIANAGSHTVFFRTEWGAFVGDDSCVTVDGTCSVTWRSGDPQELASDRRVFFIAWTLGEEEFTDVNNNGVYDDGDVHQLVDDLEEPYIDCDHNRAYSDGTGGTTYSTVGGVNILEEVLDIHTLDGAHNTADGNQSSPDCQHSTDCSAQPLIMVYHTDYVYISDEDIDTISGPLYTGLGPATQSALTNSTCNN